MGVVYFCMPPSDPDENGRGRGIMTPADRGFLKTPGDYSRQASYQRNRNIQERVLNSLLDFRLLATELDDEVIDEMFDVDRFGADVPKERASVKHGIAFLIRVALATHPQQPTLGIEPTLRPFLEDVERGIQLYLNTQHGIMADIDVSVSAANAQPIADYREGLEERDVPITGSERIKAHRVLENAGYSSEEIVDILGEPDEE